MAHRFTGSWRYPGLVSAIPELQPDDDGYIEAAVGDGPVTRYLVEKRADGTLHLVPVETLPPEIAEIIERDRQHPERRVRRQHPLTSG
jgi:hypothetical protein